MKTALQRIYVVAMMQVVARGLVATSRADPVTRRELAAYPRGYQVQMRVLPAGPGFVIESGGDGRFDLARSPKRKPDLSIGFKHPAHAFLVLSFQEGTALAFAHERMVADGDVALATRLVRCLNRMEALILPGFVARRAVKRYPDLTLREKLPTALRIYARLARHFLIGR